ncbi:MAG: 4'-phosphopantetheinyl transferase superfamily protein [Lachnospiraceae bacterium]|nr:4'-phosphopantetheinyl transferase superfamily protein [Lachnospiraceae bacterium]
MEIYISDISNIDIDTYIDEVSRCRREKVQRFNHIDDKRRSIGSELLRNYGIDQYLRENHPESLNEKRKFYLLDNGKPKVNIGQLSVEYNVSHSGKYVAVVVANVQCGIDIERKRTARQSVIDRCFNLAEQNEMDSSSDKDKTFTQIWTMKESYLKMTGDGIRDELNKVSTGFSNGISKYHFPEGINYRIFEYDDYIVTVCFMNDKKMNMNTESIHFHIIS